LLYGLHHNLWKAPFRNVFRIAGKGNFFHPVEKRTKTFCLKTGTLENRFLRKWEQRKLLFVDEQRLPHGLQNSLNRSKKFWFGDSGKAYLTVKKENPKIMIQVSFAQILLWKLLYLWLSYYFLGLSWQILNSRNRTWG
jgi:hypothetical protein